MRNYLLAAAAAAVLATPATARDNSFYVGAEGGVLFPQKQNIDGAVDFANPTVPDIAAGRIGSVKSKVGYDLDFIGGYDFGRFRLEGELGYKRAKLKNARLSDAFVNGFNAGAGTNLTSDDFDTGGHVSVFSGMINGLVDFGNEAVIAGFVGAGAGYARVKEFGDHDNAFAWQLLAGVRRAVSDHVDVGLKYRYFRTAKLRFETPFDFTGVAPGSDGTAFIGGHDRFESHSVLASLTYNFTAPEPASRPLVAEPLPPPEPAAPATQTCADGSVILATSTCPAPPPPPPAPPPAERGERGH